jgi:hypothetical protein
VALAAVGACALALVAWGPRAADAQEVTVPPTEVPTTPVTTAPEPATTTTVAATTAPTTSAPAATAPPTTRRRDTTTTSTTQPTTTTIFAIPGRPADDGGPPPTTAPLTPIRPPSGDLPGWSTTLFWVGVGGALAVMTGTWARNRHRPPVGS